MHLTWSKKMDADLREMWPHGVAVAAIAKYVGVSEKAVLRRRVRLGLSPRTADPQHDRNPVQIGPIALADMREKAILAHSFRTQSAAALEATQPISKPTPQDAVEAILSLNYETGKLVLARVGETKRPAIRDQADNWFRWTRRRP